MGAMGWMFLVSLLLFWLPIVGSLIAGYVGGKEAGGIGPAIAAAVLPAIASGLALFALGSTLTGFPVIGAITGLGGTIVLIYHSGLSLVGAIIGGTMA
jgi:hypothetical protein